MSQPDFNVIVPQPFSLANQSDEDLEKIRTEVMDKVSTWEKRQSNFFDIYFRGTDSWRIKPQASKQQKPKQLFNTKSGETHRAAETLATFWQRMITAQDPYFEALKMGLNDFGQEVSEEDLYATEGVLQTQQQASDYKRKLLRALRSLANVGTVIIEQPFVSSPYGPGRKNIEYTDFVFRPMVRTGFDTMVTDIKQSDYVFTIDFLSKYMLQNLASLDTEYWDPVKVALHIQDFGKGTPANASGVYNRIRESRARAGYQDSDANVFESLNYYGRLDPENPAVYALAESLGVDPKYVDFCVGILDATDICKFHLAPYGNWRTRFLSATYKDFEDEPLGYGIFNLARKMQRVMDINESMLDDLVAAFTLMAYKMGKYSGFTEKQLVLEPLKIIELEDIAQMAPLIPDPAAFRVALEMVNLRREDFRNIMGAKSNLQSDSVAGRSATEVGLSQNESVRGAGVHAEIFAEPLLREHLEVSHLNNLNYLDTPIWVGLTGSQKPMLIDKNALPINVGFKVKITTDKDFKPEEKQALLEAIQICTNGNYFVPGTINALPTLFKKLFRSFGLDPRLLNQQLPVATQMQNMLERSIQNGGAPSIPGQEPQGMAGPNSTAQVQKTPVGPVLTSPHGANQVQTEGSAQ